MSTTEPSSTAEAPSGVPTYVVDVIGLGKKAKLLLVFAGLLIGVAWPVSLLLFEPTGYDVICKAEERHCLILEHYAFETLRSQIDFEDIHVVQSRPEWREREDGGRYQTGRIRITFERRGGGSISASLYATAEQLRLTELREFVKAPSGDEMVSRSRRRPIEGAMGVLVFLLGLIIFGGATWRTAVALDTNSGTLVVTRHRFPRLKRVTLRTHLEDIEFVDVAYGQGHQEVVVKLKGGERVEVARTVARPTADGIYEAINRMRRRGGS